MTLDITATSVTPEVPDSRHRRRNLVAGALVAAAAVAILGAVTMPSEFAKLLVIAIVGVTATVAAIRNPVWALVLLLATMLFRLALPSVGADPFLIAFALLVVSAGVWLAGNPADRPRLGAVEVAMGLYVAWNVYSLLLPHDLPALTDATLADQLPLFRYLLVGSVIPFLVYYVSRAIFTKWATLRVLLVALVVIGALSAAVSILQFTGPQSLVWPRYIIDSPNWVGRANGFPNQPGANGVVLVTGYAVAVYLATALKHPMWRRMLLWAAAAACGYAIYLTYTRAAYLGFLVVVLLGALLAKNYRKPFITTLAVMAAGIALNWTAFTSSNRYAGGVASTNEVYDRLNANMTALWAFSERPWAGWGLGRFVALNTYHHQRWSDDVPWDRGLGVSAHFNELGILAELGIVGLVLWLAVLVLVFRLLLKAIWKLPVDRVFGRPLALTATMVMASLVVLGLFADLRLLDFPNAVAFCLAGAAVGALDRHHAAKTDYVRVPTPRF